MTAKEWIIYILENELEDEPMFKDGRLLGFMTIGEAAVKFGVGTATVRWWVNDNELPALMIGNEVFIPINSERPNV